MNKRDQPDPGDEKQADVLERINSALPVARRILATTEFRERYLLPQDYYSVGRTIYYTPEAVAKAERFVDAPEIASQFFMTRIVERGNHPGTCWVEDPDKPGSKAPAIIDKALWRRLEKGRVRGRVINVERIEDVNGITWRQAELSRPAMI